VLKSRRSRWVIISEGEKNILVEMGGTSLSGVKLFVTLSREFCFGLFAPECTWSANGAYIFGLGSAGGMGCRVYGALSCLWYSGCGIFLKCSPATGRGELLCLRGDLEVSSAAGRERMGDARESGGSSSRGRKGISVFSAVLDR